MGQVAPPATCEWEGCPEERWYRVDAQWTIVDFIAYEVCIDHLNDTVDMLQGRMVDGQFAIDVSITTLWPAGDIPLAPGY